MEKIALGWTVDGVVQRSKATRKVKKLDRAIGHAKDAIASFQKLISVLEQERQILLDEKTLSRSLEDIRASWNVES